MWPFKGKENGERGVTERGKEEGKEVGVESGGKGERGRVGIGGEWEGGRALHRLLPST